MAFSRYKVASAQSMKKKSQRLYIEAFQYLLADSGITSQFKLADVVTLTPKGVSMYAGELTLQWKEPDENGQRHADDKVVIVLSSGVMIDIDNPELHRIDIRELTSALEQALQVLLETRDTPTALYKEAELCLKRFYPNRQEPVECLMLISSKLFTSKKLYIRGVFESADVCRDLMPNSGSTTSMKGVRVTLAITTEKVRLSAVIFKAFKIFGVDKTPEEQATLYRRLCSNPKISPSYVYGAILAYAYTHKLENASALAVVRAVLGVSRY